MTEAQAPAGLYRYRFANVEFDEAQNLLWVAGQQEAVEPLPLQLLATLLRRPDEVVARAELFDALWQGRPTVDHVLANAVSKLRRALGEKGGARLINVPRIGYRLKGPFERVAAGRQTGVPVQGLAAGQPVPGREDFVLQRRMEGGGAGAVWLARHRRLPQTRVFKFAGSGEQVAALKREFTVCRLLYKELGRRPDLVEVKDSNFAHVPYFLGYDDAGLDLRTWAESGSHLAAMSAQARVELFLQMARAVAAAHGVGVLHRDLKPANVLIEDGRAAASDAADAEDAAPRWRVRLSDFGSGHLLAPDRLAALGVTALGMTVTDGSQPLLGATPHYLAPELLGGASASTRSDLYALGLMLYQILVGDLRRLLATGWEHDLQDPLLVDDVRAATEGRPERRLASVAQLIERLESLELRRRQREQAAEAARRLQHIAEQLAKSQSRRRWLAALSVCIALGGLCSAWLGVQARAAQQRAEQASTRARLINDFLNVDVLQSADALQVVAANPGITMVDVLMRASVRASERFRDDMPVLAQIRRQLGDIYLRTGFDDHAEYEYHRVIAMLEPTAPAADGELLAARFGLALALTGRDRPQTALAELDQAERAAGQALLAAPTPLSRLALRARVQVLMDAQRYADALPAAQRLVQRSDESLEGAELQLSHRVRARLWLAEIHTRMDEPARAAGVLKELAAPPFNAGNAADLVAATIRLQQARELIRQNRLNEAEPLLTALRAAPAQTFGPQGLPRGWLDEAWFELHQRSGRFEAALQAGEAARQAYSAQLGPQHSRVTIAGIHVALSELGLGKPAQALRGLAAARARLDANGRYGRELLAIDLARARALTDLGRAEEAIELLQGLQPGSAPAGEHPAAEAALELQAEMGRALTASGRSAEGLALVIQALAAMRQAHLPPALPARYEAWLARARAGPRRSPG